ncbi:hypothetical protein ACFP2T_20715 [Plantactinospora solaniradicis]|uniref:ESX-1 secretion-associated protein n=1 Tax=Plantactinospora solaniradicis TaxID=1723736 RepID=A0ABW1KCR9_9ACTN
MNGLRDLAGRLDSAGGNLADLARRLPYSGPGESAFHADGPGRLGEVGRALHRQWVTALDNRARELAATAERLTDTAAALRVAAREYADTDDAARRRHSGEA